MQKDTSKTCCIQVKGSQFVVLDSYNYIEKIDHQLERSSFQSLHQGNIVGQKIETS